MGYFLNHKALLRALLLIPVLLSNTSYATDAGININDESIALHGYDPVSYFQETPVEGKDSLKFQHQGVTYLFSTQKNLSQFSKAPGKYQPLFGGYCAYGVRMGKKFDIDPLAYAIEDGNLYVLLDRSTKKIWDQERKRNIAIAERIWPSIKSVPAGELEK